MFCFVLSKNMDSFFCILRLAATLSKSKSNHAVAVDICTYQHNDRITLYSTSMLFIHKHTQTLKIPNSKQWRTYSKAIWHENFSINSCIIFFRAIGGSLVVLVVLIVILVVCLKLRHKTRTVTKDGKYHSRH